MAHGPVKRLTDGRGVDVAIEALGKQETFENALRSTRAGGTLSSLVGSPEARIGLIVNAVLLAALFAIPQYN